MEGPRQLRFGLIGVRSRVKLALWPHFRIVKVY